MPGQQPDELVVDLENRVDAVTLQIAAMPDNLETAELLAELRQELRLLRAELAQVSNG
jgi:hypothetical protein